MACLILETSISERESEARLCFAGRSRSAFKIHALHVLSPRSHTQKMSLLAGGVAVLCCAAWVKKPDHDQDWDAEE